MELRNWGILILTLILMFLIFSFLKTIFKSDEKKFAYDRLYVDYSTYQKPKSLESGGYPIYRTAKFYEQVELGKQYAHHGRFEFMAKAFEDGMKAALEKAPVPEDMRRTKNPAFDRYIELGNKPIPELAQAKLHFAKRNYQQALIEFTEILNKLPPEDLQHQMQLCDFIAECYFNLNNCEKYVEFKVKRIQCLRQIRKLVLETFPNKKDEGEVDWISSEEATQNLLRIQSYANAKLEEPERELVIRRARFDLEVAREISKR